MNDLTKLGDYGRVPAIRPDLLGPLVSLKGLARGRSERGPWLLAVSREMAARLGVPPGQRLLDLEGFEYRSAASSGCTSPTSCPDMTWSSSTWMSRR